MLDSQNIDKKGIIVDEYDEDEEDRWEDESINFEPESERENKWDEED